MVNELYSVTEVKKNTTTQPSTIIKSDQAKGFLTGIFNKKKN